ncbi:Glycine betaine/L-proline transport ATP-binding protein ProV [Raoultella terrigena]|uniref:Glycine betaine/L-proline transport ATP-binding protein ProV n=1 Tax=Raoultella terrigena TaxID=577 RepID=A0A4U9D1T3_RAOTE|nr:Glycine betaine/L-proline transport ATP-binding protein ProV [Raoultella terrigena]
MPVVDEGQQYIGIISKRMLLQALDREGQTMLINLTRGIPHRRRIAPHNLPMPGALRPPHLPTAAVQTG